VAPQRQEPLVNGVDVVPFVEAELNRRFPAAPSSGPGIGRSARRLGRSSTWAATLERVAAMPDGTVDVSVDGEWSFSDTLRHLVQAADMWLGRSVLEIEQPFHPVGLLDAATAAAGGDAPSQPRTPSRRGPAGPGRPIRHGPRLPRHRRPDELAAEPGTRDPAHPETTLSCLHVILEEGGPPLPFATSTRSGEGLPPLG
jgi:hypothetical protein